MLPHSVQEQFSSLSVSANPRRFIPKYDVKKDSGRRTVTPVKRTALLCESATMAISFCSIEQTLKKRKKRMGKGRRERRTKRGGVDDRTSFKAVWK